MASTYPGTVQTFTNPVGTNTLDSPDHAVQHTTENDTLVNIQNTLGTTAGTALLTAFLSTDKPVRMNASGTPSQTLTGGTINTFIVGTPTVTGGTFTSITANTATLGSPTITGGTLNTFIAGTPTVTGGTFTSITANTATVGSPTITGGTINSAVLGTPIVTVINSSGTTVPTTFGESIAPTVITLSDSAGGTITPNAAAGQVQMLTLGTTAGNRTLGTPTNATSGQALTLGIKASGSANGTLVWAGIYRFSQDVGTPAIGTGTTWNYYGWRYNTTDTKWDFTGQSRNII